MYSKAEMQHMKREFWIAFAEKYPRKWLLYDTKIKDFALKFDAGNRHAAVMIDIESKDQLKRYAYFEKLESLKSVIEEEYLADLIFYRDITLENGKTVSKIEIRLDDVGISNRNSWDKIFDFFYEKMSALEIFFYEFEDYIRDI